MKISKQQIRSALLAALFSLSLLLGFTVHPVLAFEDVMLMPAIKTDKASKSILTDVAWAGDRLVAVGVRGHIVYSENGGVDWAQAEVPIRVNLTSVSFPTAMKGWVSGHGGVVLHTEDGGKTWHKQFDGDMASRLMLASAKQRVSQLELAVEAAEPDQAEDLLWALDVAGWAIEDAQRDLDIGPSKPIMDLWFKDAEEGFAVGAYGYFFHTSDGGKTWEDYAPRIDNPDGLHLYAVNGLKGDAVYIVGEQGTVYRSSDAGVTWEKLSSLYTGGFFGVFGTDVDGQVCVFGLKGNAFYSEDSGENWQKVATNVRASLFSGQILENKRHVFVGEKGAILVCDENFGSCKVVPSKERKISSAAVSLPGNRILVVGMGGTEIVSLDAP